MGTGIGGVIELAGDIAAGDGGGQLIGLFYSAGHALFSGGEDYFRAVGG